MESAVDVSKVIIVTKEVNKFSSSRDGARDIVKPEIYNGMEGIAEALLCRAVCIDQFGECLNEVWELVGR